MLQSIDQGTEVYRQLKREHPTAYDFGNPYMLNRIGYELLRLKRNEDAIQVFNLLVAAFPEASNPYDSLGEAYFVSKQYPLALKNYKKSLALNPENGNAAQMIEEINGIIASRVAQP